MRKMLKFTIICFIFITENYYAQEVIMKDDHVYAKYTYVLGDNDSKSEGRRLCYLEAKRLCLEKAGVYIESNTTIKNYQLTLDEIKSYTGAIIQFEVIHEKIKMIGKSLAIFAQ